MVARNQITTILIPLLGTPAGQSISIKKPEGNAARAKRSTKMSLKFFSRFI